MSELKKFNSIKTEGKTSSKPINILRKEEEDIISKSMRIYENDYKTIKKIAYEEDKKMVEVVKEAIAMLDASKQRDK